MRIKSFGSVLGLLYPPAPASLTPHQVRDATRTQQTPTKRAHQQPSAASQPSAAASQPAAPPDPQEEFYMPFFALLATLSASLLCHLAPVDLRVYIKQMGVWGVRCTQRHTGS